MFKIGVCEKQAQGGCTYVELPIECFSVFVIQNKKDKARTILNALTQLFP